MLINKYMNLKNGLRKNPPDWAELITNVVKRYVPKVIFFCVQF